MGYPTKHMNVLILKRREILAKLEKKMRERLPDYCDLIPAEAFVKSVIGGGFVDSDGQGYWATVREMDRHAPVCPSQIVRGAKQPDWATHVAWFNR